MLTKNRCSVKVFIQTNVLEVKVMFNKYKNKLLTNIVLYQYLVLFYSIFHEFIS